MISHLDLFSGIGGFSLGLEIAEVSAPATFVEIDPFCQQVLKKHWPSVPIFSDIREVSITLGQFPLITGGFPCQDVSLASGKEHNSILGDRSGLWFEFARLIGEGKPNWVIIENVEALRTKGFNQILYDLASLGYDAEWHIIPAYATGLPHARKRLWVIAHRMRDRMERGQPFPLQGISGFPWNSPERGFEDFWQRSRCCSSRLCRSISRIPYGMDRLRSLGNSIVPQIAGIIGLAIQEWEIANNA